MSTFDAVRRRASYLVVIVAGWGAVTTTYNTLTLYGLGYMPYLAVPWICFAVTTFAWAVAENRVAAAYRKGHTDGRLAEVVRRQAEDLNRDAHPLSPAEHQAAMHAAARQGDAPAPTEPSST